MERVALVFKWQEAYNILSPYMCFLTPKFSEDPFHLSLAIVLYGAMGRVGDTNQTFEVIMEQFISGHLFCPISLYHKKVWGNGRRWRRVSGYPYICESSYW